MIFSSSCNHFRHRKFKAYSPSIGSTGAVYMGNPAKLLWLMLGKGCNVLGVSGAKGMALPNENRTAKVIAVEEAIGKMSPQELAALPGLDGEDFKVVGTLIQHFSFMDLNLRRALELFKLSKMLPKSAEKLYPDLPDS